MNHEEFKQSRCRFDGECLWCCKRECDLDEEVNDVL